MSARRYTLMFLAGSIAGCMAAGPPLPAQAPPSASASRSLLGPTLILDPMDLRIGTTVQFSRIPSRGELHDLRQAQSLARVVMVLPAWPASYGELQSLDELGQESDVVIVLPGYPPTREAAEAWNLAAARVRIVMVVDRPPPSSTVIADLNGMRGLERVIARIDPPSRAGFERLQRPLGFWKIVD